MYSVPLTHAKAEAETKRCAWERGKVEGGEGRDKCAKSPWNIFPCISFSTFGEVKVRDRGGNAAGKAVVRQR